MAVCQPKSLIWSLGKNVTTGLKRVFLLVKTMAQRSGLQCALQGNLQFNLPVHFMSQFNACKTFLIDCVIHPANWSSAWVKKIQGIVHDMTYAFVYYDL